MTAKTPVTKALGSKAKGNEDAPRVVPIKAAASPEGEYELPTPRPSRPFDTVVAVAMVCTGIWLLTACETDSTRLGRINVGPTAQVFFNNGALPDSRSGPVQSFEAQYAGKTYRGQMKRAGNSWVANLGGVPMNTSAGIEFRILANDQMVYQAYQSNVQFSSASKSVRIDDCNVKVGWSGTLHQGSCRWTVR